MPESQLPRRVYFSAEDHASLADSPSVGQQQRQTIEATRRQNLAENLIRKAEMVAAAVKTLRAYDGTGNTQHALPHLGATVADLNAAHRALIGDVSSALERHARHERMKLGLSYAAAAEADHPAGRALDQQILTESITAISAAAHDAAAGRANGDFVAVPRASALAAVDAAEAATGTVSAPKPGPRA
jgi:hypothetical protein